MGRIKATADAARHVALSPQVFQVLLSLTDGPMHGYAIIQDIRTRTNGEVRLTASTLYDALARLVDQALIEELEQPTEADGRRRSYHLTALGHAAAQAEARRLERLIAMAREKRLLGRRS